MKRYQFFLIPAIFGAGLAGFWGCSGDNSTDPVDLGAGTVTLEKGDTLAQDYLGALNVHDWVFENINILLTQALWLIDDRIDENPDSVLARFSSANKQAASSMYYDSLTDFWHYENHFIRGSFEFTEIDSLQFLQDSLEVQWPDSALVTSIRAGLSWLWTENSGDAFDTVYRSGIDITLVSLPGFIAGFGDAILRGSAYSVGRPFDQPAEITEGCGFETDMAVTLTDLTLTLNNIYKSAGWPYSGVIEMSGPITQACVGDSVSVYSDTWKIITVYSGIQTRTVENSTYYW